MTQDKSLFKSKLFTQKNYKINAFFEIKVNNYKKPLKKIIKSELLGKYDRLIKNKTDLANYGYDLVLILLKNNQRGEIIYLWFFSYKREKNLSSGHK